MTRDVFIDVISEAPIVTLRFLDAGTGEIIISAPCFQGSFVDWRRNNDVVLQNINVVGFQMNSRNPAKTNLNAPVSE